MYARSIGSRHRGTAKAAPAAGQGARTGRAVHISAPRPQIVPPPDYSGSGVFDETRAQALPEETQVQPVESEPQSLPYETLFQDGTASPAALPARSAEPIPVMQAAAEDTPRYPLPDQGRYDTGEDAFPTYPELGGAPSIRLPVPFAQELELRADDLLLVALMILLLSEGSDEETILILAFLLLAK